MIMELLFIICNNVVRSISKITCNINRLIYNCSERYDMFIKALTKKYGDNTHYYASLVESVRQGCRAVSVFPACRHKH